MLPQQSPAAQDGARRLFGFSQERRSCRLWAACILPKTVQGRALVAGQDRPQLPALGPNFPVRSGKYPQLKYGFPAPSGKQPHHQFIGGRRPSILAGTRQRLRRDRLGEPERSASGERLSREAEAAAPVFRSPSPSVGSNGRRQGRAGSEGQRTALISAFFSSDQQAVRLTRRPGATRSRPDEPERGCKLKLSGPSGKQPHHQFIGGRWPSILAGTRQRLRRDRLGEPKRSERLSQEAEAAAPVFRSPSPSVGSDGQRQGRAGSEGQRTALISASSVQISRRSD